MSPAVLDQEIVDFDGFIRETIEQRFHRKVESIERRGKDNNNFIRSVVLSTCRFNSLAHLHGSHQPGTVKLPETTSKVIMKFPNPAALISEADRVRNEVAAMVLMRDALRSINLESLVPHVYDWNQADDVNAGNSWIMMEYKDGVMLESVFDGLRTERKRKVITQIAGIFHAIQSYVVPPSVKGYGGLTFNAQGDVAAGPFSITGRGPTDSLVGMHLYTFQEQLEIADRNPEISMNGWRNTSTKKLRQRLDKFAAEGLLPLVERNSRSGQTLVHGDFSIANLLFDEISGNLTALLDFDFSHIASVADEYMLSFADIGGLVVGPFESTAFKDLRIYQLSSALATEQLKRPAGRGVDWNLATTWRQALEEARVIQPQSIPGMDEYSALIWFLQDLCPPYLMMPRYLANKSAKFIENKKMEALNNLDSYLKRWGY